MISFLFTATYRYNNICKWL